MAEDKKADEKKTNAEIEALKVRNAELEQLVASMAEKRVPTKADLKAAREAKEAERKAIGVQKDKEAKDLVTIQKLNRDGEILRERVCARVDVAWYERQGFKVAKAV